MDAFTTFKLYTAMKLHFTTSSYDIFKTKGAVKAKYETFELRRDVPLFERLGKQFEMKSHLIEFLVANYAQCNDNIVYDQGVAFEHYQNWMATKGRLSYQFNEDFNKLISIAGFTSKMEEVIITAFLSREIQPQTLAILDSELGIVDTLLNTPKFVMIFDILKRLSKIKQFVKYDKPFVKQTLSTLVDSLDA